MARTREIKKRIKAVGNIRRITKTMQMIATAKFAAAQARAVATKPYTEGVFDLVMELGANLAKGGGDFTHPLISGAGPAAEKAPELLLVITSDRGLCGAYNGSVLRAAMAHIRKAQGAGRDLSIELVGRKGLAFLRYNNLPIAHAHSLGDKPTFQEVERLAQQYMDRFTRGEISGVRVAFMKFLSAGRQAPTVMQLLPLQAPEKKEAPAPGPGAPGAPGASSAQPAEADAVTYEFSPSAPELLGDLLPAAVKATLFQAVNDAIVSEHVARMIAMKAATDNAGKMGKLLTRKYNRARQAQITTELTEIVTGAAALE